MPNIKVYTYKQISAFLFYRLRGAKLRIYFSPYKLLSLIFSAMRNTFFYLRMLVGFGEATIGMNF